MIPKFIMKMISKLFRKTISLLLEIQKLLDDVSQLNLFVRDHETRISRLEGRLEALQKISLPSSIEPIQGIEFRKDSGNSLKDQVEPDGQDPD